MRTDELIKRQRCPLCGSPHHLLHIDFNDVPVVACQDCQFIFSSRIMPSNALLAYYTDGFGGNRQRLGQQVNAGINMQVLAKLFYGDISGIRSALDVGAGYGFFLAALSKNHDCQVVGVELSKQEADFGRTQLDIDIRNSLLSTAGLSPASFDLITTFEVIEHTHDPVAFISELREYLAPGGLLLIGTDNFESRVVKALGPSFPKWIPHTHVSHFSPVTLSRTLERCQLKIVSQCSFTPWEFLAREMYYRLTRKTFSANESFNLSDALATEMKGEYRLFALRSRINRLWARLQMMNDANGAMMYFLCRRATDQ